MTRIPSAERRERLVEAALRVIAERGVEGATTRAIVAEAGMALASFHYAFRSRDELLGELVATVVHRQREAVVAGIGPDLRASVRAGLQIYFDMLVADPQHERALLELMHYALRTPGLEPLVKAQWATYHATAEHVAVAGAAAANARWRIPVADIARLIITVTDGVTLAWLADRDDAAAARTLDAAAEAITAFAEALEGPR